MPEDMFSHGAAHLLFSQKTGLDISFKLNEMSTYFQEKIMIFQLSSANVIFSVLLFKQTKTFSKIHYHR